MYCIFHSLLGEMALSLKVTSALKSSLNSLLCAMCRVHPSFLTFLLDNCQASLERDGSDLATLLHTLAHAAQSQECTKALLASSLLSKVVLSLKTTFVTLADALSLGTTTTTSVEDLHVAGGVRSMFSRACIFLAFLTDFCRNWGPALDWIGSAEGSVFWMPMLHLFSMDTAPLISAVELSFCQDVVCEFFETCLACHAGNKTLFVRLLLDAIRGNNASPETVGLVDGVNARPACLTPFLYKLVASVVLKEEVVPVVLCDGSESKPLLLTRTQEAFHFHPSFPIGQRSYLLHLPSSCTVNQLRRSLHPCVTGPALHHQTSSGKPAPPLPPPPPKPSQEKPLQKDLFLELLKLHLRSWRVLEGDLEEPPPPLPSPEGRRPQNSSSSSGSYSSVLVSLCSDGSYWEPGSDWTLAELMTVVLQRSSTLAAVVVLRRERTCASSSDSQQKRTKPPPPPPSSLNSLTRPAVPTIIQLFIEGKGLELLYLCLPDLYPYHWPRSYSSLRPPLPLGCEHTPRHGSRFRSQVHLGPPSHLPLHSVVMLGLCMGLPPYARFTWEALSPMTLYVLLRVLVGAEVKGQ